MIVHMFTPEELAFYTVFITREIIYLRYIGFENLDICEYSKDIQQNALKATALEFNWQSE